jgi:hypothetical protein
VGQTRVAPRPTPAPFPGRAPMDAARSMTTEVVVVAGDVEVATVRVTGPMPPDLSVVDAVARLALAAGRLGWSVRVPNPCGHVRGLLDLVGLTDVVGAGAEPSEESALEAQREPEGREQLGVQEVVPPRDAPA